MNNSIDASCDKCSERFTITKFRCEDVGAGVEKTFFRCPHCYQEYVAFYTDVEIRQLQKDIRFQQKQLKVLQTYKARQKILKKIEQLQKSNKEKMNVLRSRVER